MLRASASPTTLYGTGKTILRGGYGIFYFQDRGGIDNQLGQQVPFGGSVSYTPSQGYRIGFTGQAPLKTQCEHRGSTARLWLRLALPLPGFPRFNRQAPPPGSNVFSVNTTEKTSNVEQYEPAGAAAVRQPHRGHHRLRGQQGHASRDGL